ncbi:hypothetical protein SEA_GILDA_54 [Microbacterium phage Gilda]|uniref:Uncharacterized protein n=6 Tax=Krampusvirus krampus TaxID=2734242 RepID=A0A4Y6EH96_9CAUD|nr:hypothetical protein HOT40_gp54 [Microbacterium phage Krampus]AWY04510.1 hypothetical protein SEA_ANNASERENA_54 [Microbacterium phage AnnaSerena]QDF18106.1 hypothetical protein SEA_ANAKIN_54 [Microbacterium phage Anakin]QDF18188.1 hypothetical protein SEA_NARUTORUN_54 [Microbacterium phage NarutoRun]QOC58713.1 hypothetical protein SEA_GILDA_54 [Microbacterium phage Gilda]URP21721.1 hypothetical protein SEA_KATE_55 [Microbacterium phage Kate]WNT45048.1 hypothetical protein SEA_PHUNAPHOKE_54
MTMAHVMRELGRGKVIFDPFSDDTKGKDSVEFADGVLISFNGAESDQLHDILAEHLPDMLDLFIKKNAEYGSGEQSSGTYLGARGQFADIWRKIGKLKIGLWDGNEAQLTTESVDEILRDMIGHCFLALQLRALERRIKAEAALPDWRGRQEVVARATPDLRHENAADPTRYANDDEIARHAEKQSVSWADAWRYFERQGYDMSKASPQYPHEDHTSL